METALVTGAASGIGRAVAGLLVQRGCCVALCDRDTEAVEAAARALDAEHPGRARAYPLDLRDRLAVQRTASRIEAAHGPIDALVSAAGVLRLGPAVPSAPGGEAGRPLSLDDLRDSFAVHVEGLFHLAQALLPGMVARRRGALVTVASNAARTPRLGMAAYAASKAAAVSLTRSLGLEVAGHGVRCNVVSPGSTDTPMQRSLWADGLGAEQVIAGSLAHHRLGIPLGRIAHPKDVAEAVVYLLSDAARHITLQELCVDGGATL